MKKKNKIIIVIISIIFITITGCTIYEITTRDKPITENKTKKTVKKKSDSVENKDAKKDEGKKTLNDEEKVEEKPKRKRGRPRKEEVKLND